MKKLDFVLIIAVLLSAAVLLAIMSFNQADSEDTLYLEIYRDGTLIERIILPDEAAEIEIRTDNGYNIVRLTKTSASIIESDCSGQDCVHSPSLTRSGSVTACLPHSLLIRLVSDEKEKDNGEEEVDIVA